MPGPAMLGPTTSWHTTSVHGMGRQYSDDGDFVSSSARSTSAVLAGTRATNPACKSRAASASTYRRAAARAAAFQSSPSISSSSRPRKVRRCPRSGDPVATPSPWDNRSRSIERNVYLGEVAATLGEHRAVVLEATPAEALDVDAGLDGMDVALFERVARAGGDERDRLVVAEADAVPGVVDEVLPVAALGDDTAADGVDLLGARAGPGGGQRRGLGALDELVHLALAVARRTDGDRPRHVGPVAVHHDAELDDDEVAPLELARRRHGVAPVLAGRRAGGDLAPRESEAGALVAAALTPDGAFDRRRDRRLGRALDAVLLERAQADGGDFVGDADARELGRRFARPKLVEQVGRVDEAVAADRF